LKAFHLEGLLVEVREETFLPLSSSPVLPGRSFGLYPCYSQRLRRLYDFTSLYDLSAPEDAVPR
jgi:hypothetical protein